MSGGSGGGGGFVPSKPIGSGQKLAAENPCSIDIKLPLSAVEPAEAGILAAGDELNIELVEEKDVISVVAKNPKRNNAIVGAIAYAGIQELIDCINEGYEYTARVLDATKTSVKVRVSRK